MKNQVFIKPCPWCGSPGSLEVINLGFGNGRGYQGCHRYQVSCLNCRAIAPNGRYDDIYIPPEEAKEKAIDTWNLRAVNT